MMTVAVIVAVAVLALVVVNRQAFLRMLGAGKAQVGKLGRAVEEADPLALLNQAVDDGVTQIENAQRGLENAKFLVRQVARQVEGGKKEKARLENRIKAVLDQGDPNNSAKEYALQLAGIQSQLVSNEEQLGKHQETYENWAKQVEVGRRKVVEARQKAQRLGVELEMSKREKELGEFANNFSFDPNNLNQGLAHAEELIQAQIEKNRAVGDVARDMSKASVAQAADEELEREAEANAILDQFRKKPESPATQGFANLRPESPATQGFANLRPESPATQG